jgi:PTS system mannitol-specific IIC component
MNIIIILFVKIKYIVINTQRFFDDTKIFTQRLGNFLSKMIMPIIGAFIGFGLIATVGCYLPNGDVQKAFSTLTSLMIMYLLPLLIAFLGGKLIGDIKGGVVGAMFALSLIMAGQYAFAPSYIQELLDGNDMLMFLGAMIVGPIGGLIIKLVDPYVQKITPTGFEMLFNNLAIGIVGMVLMIIGYFGISYPIVGFT